MLKFKLGFAAVIMLILAGCAAQGTYLKLDPSVTRDIKVYNDIQYAPLTKLCEAYSIECKWDSFVRTAVLSKNGKIVLRAGSDRILLNGEAKKLSSPVLFTNGTVYVPVSFARNDLGCIVTGICAEPVRAKAPVVMPEGRYAIRSIVLDPGHGGKDGGAVGRRLKLKESRLTLDVARRLRKILEENGIKVMMTRDSDVFIPLSKRAQIANASGADLFVSIHINASRTRSMNGFECYYLSEATDDNARATEALENEDLNADEGTVLAHSNALDKALWDMKLTENRRESAELAGYICDAVDNSLIARNRGVKTARFYVLKFTTIPSVLVEVGYLSNKFEELKLKDENYIKRMTEVIAKGILSYKDKYARTDGFTR